MNRNDEWIVKEQTELLKYLYEVLSSRSRNSVKGILNRGQVLVNGKVSTQFNNTLNPGDRVQIHARVATDEVKMTGVTILYEDNDLIAIEKEARLIVDCI